MAVTNTVQILIDGPRNTVAKVTGDALQNDGGAGVLPVVSNVVILDPTTLTKMLPGLAGGGPGPQLLRIDRIEFSISDGIAIQLYWKATSNVLITEISGRGKLEMKNFGGWTNNAGAGVNGQILMTIIPIDTTATTAQPVSWVFNIQTAKYLFNGVQGA